MCEWVQGVEAAAPASDPQTCDAVAAARDGLRSSDGMEPPPFFVWGRPMAGSTGDGAFHQLTSKT